VPGTIQVLTAIQGIQNWELDTLHLLVTSREEQDIEDTLSGLISHEVPMDGKLIDSDIRVHVSRTIEDNTKFRMFSAVERRRW
jgi:hypothetical protein